MTQERPSGRVGSRVGPFEVVGTLGQGGMGVVYRARELASGREVALKVLLDPSHPTRLQRFRREAELTASLEHEGVVRVLDAGDLEGRPFIAYELVDGATTLADDPWIQPLRTRVERIRDAARALGHAHAQGIVHRDVKPENVLVSRDGRVKVADFGLAVAQDVQQRLTRTGTMLGTPAYMPPEMLRGKKDDQGAASDVWALGVLLYRALTGRMPFEGATLADLAGAVIDHDPPPPSRLNPAVDGDLDAVALRCLEKDVRGRLPHGEALALELDRWLAGAATAAGRAARTRRRAAFAGAAAGWLVVAAALLLVAAG